MGTYALSAKQALIFSPMQLTVKEVFAGGCVSLWRERAGIKAVDLIRPVFNTLQRIHRVYRAGYISLQAAGAEGTVTHPFSTFNVLVNSALRSAKPFSPPLIRLVSSSIPGVSASAFSFLVFQK